MRPDILRPTPEREEKKPSLRFGIYYPGYILDNETIGSWNIITRKGNHLAPDDITRLVGATERRIALPHETPEYMAIAATKTALGANERADIVFIATSFPTGASIADIVNYRLGLGAERTMNIHAACSGTDVAFEYLASLGEKAHGKRVVIGGSERYSPYLYDLRNPNPLEVDRSMAQTIFSDGAAATTFVYDRDLTILSHTHKQFDPEKSQALRMPIDYTKMVEPFIYIPIPQSKSKYFEQEGREVLNAVAEEVPPLIRQTVKKAGLKPEDIKLIISHQGSKPVVEKLASELREYRLIRDYREGNWSSGSIIKALKSAIDKGIVRYGDIVVLAGFGAGLFASIVVVKLGPVEQQEEIEEPLAA